MTRPCGDDMWFCSRAGQICKVEQIAHKLAMLTMSKRLEIVQTYCFLLQCLFGCPHCVLVRLSVDIVVVSESCDKWQLWCILAHGVHDSQEMGFLE